ncbi:MAG: CRISPR system precrRNA processing endoribonuclease RAMP protein Cas6 [Deltaproteobacteria bacterium]|nr:CRISPR system precrRNA processing endoribonuclease RAMP protein Cas6 [Deltaproteobacteria bacterium]
MIPDFSLQHFRFHLEPKGALQMPAFNKGNVIRGGFGSTFRRIVCHGNCRDPETCQLRMVCPYTAVFHPFVPEGSEKISRNRDIPRPFVIKAPLETKEVYRPGEQLIFDLIVVGKARDYLPYFIVTFKELSHSGLGRGRTPCELSATEAISADGQSAQVYTSSTNMVRPPSADIDWKELAGEETTAKDGNSQGNSSRIRLKFLTPTTLKVDGRLIKTPHFSHIVRRLRDRISALSYFYCNKGLDIDFKAFGEEAEKIKTISDSTRWVDSARYSRRRETVHDLSGFVGEAVYEGSLAPFIPYLKLGEYLHVGKNAVFGNGWFRIEEVN